MSRILRRPMFRGGKVDSYGTGIASGLGTRSGYFRGGGVSYNPFSQSQTQNLVQSYTPQGIPQPFVDFFKANQANQRPTSRFRQSPGATLQDAEGLYASLNTSPSGILRPGSDYGEPLSEEDIEESLKQGGIFDSYTFEGGYRKGKDMDLEPSSRIEEGLFGSGVFDKADELRERRASSVPGSTFSKTEAPGLEAIRQQNIEEIDTSPKEIKKTRIEDDEPEVTMTDLEKALGLDRARQEYAADALAAASKAFFEGRGFEAIADAAAVKSKAPDIKRLAGLEEFKAKKAKELYALKKKQFAPGNVEKTVEYLVSQGVDKDEAIRRATKQSGTFAEELSKHMVGSTILPSGFAIAVEAFYGKDYKGDVTAVEVINADKSTTLPDGIYSDKDNKLIFEVKNKKVISDRNYG